MSMVSVTYVVDVRAADFERAQLQRVLVALENVEAVARVEIDETFAREVPAELSRRILWATGADAALRAWARVERRGFAYATLEVDGLTSPEVHLRTLEELFDAGVAPLVRAIAPEGVKALAALRERSAPIAADAGTSDVAPLGVTMNRRRLRADGALVAGPDVPIWDLDPSVLRLHLDANDGGLFTPDEPRSFQLPDRTMLRVFLTGGATAMALAAATIECRASLGFRNAEEFDEWLAQVVREETGLPLNLIWLRPIQAFDRDGVLHAGALPRSLPAGVVVASALLREDARDDVEELLGLRLRLAGATSDGKPYVRLIELDALDIAQRQTELARGGLELLASACGVIAICRAPLAARRAALGTLAFLGVPPARAIARSIEHNPVCTEELRAHSRRMWRDRPGKSVRERIAREHDPRAIAKHLEEQLDRLASALSGEAR